VLNSRRFDDEKTAALATRMESYVRATIALSPSAEGNVNSCERHHDAEGAVCQELMSLQSPYNVASCLSCTARKMVNLFVIPGVLAPTAPRSCTGELKIPSFNAGDCSAASYDSLDQRNRRVYIRMRCVLQDSAYLAKNRPSIFQGLMSVSPYDMRLRFINDDDEVINSFGIGVQRDWIGRLWTAVYSTGIFEPAADNENLRLSACIRLVDYDQTDMETVMSMAAAALFMHINQKMSIGNKINYAVYMGVFQIPFSLENIKKFDNANYNRLAGMLPRENL
jgi:hypothetical protein